MVKSADTADLKSVAPKGVWGFKSPSGHHLSFTLRHVALFPEEGNLQAVTK